KIELVQLEGRDGDTAYNLQRTLDAMATCKADTDLLVFPETQLMGFANAEQVPHVAEPLLGPSLEAVRHAEPEQDVA
ncbi:nitrilase-related carbon-nitrogen hydrolase, partial [Pseudomonas sp. BJa5]|uniref:nitrilase-related carbon-nitrogen hydrolase n=1 Tax=Pseudomonas sp. BJa5 TaxID=2936270 RepID=UPI00255A2DB7